MSYGSNRIDWFFTAEKSHKKHDGRGNIWVRSNWVIQNHKSFYAFCPRLRPTLSWIVFPFGIHAQKVFLFLIFQKLTRQQLFSLRRLIPEISEMPKSLLLLCSNHWRCNLELHWAAGYRILLTKLAYSESNRNESTILPFKGEQGQGSKSAFERALLKVTLATVATLMVLVLLLLFMIVLWNVPYQ